MSLSPGVCVTQLAVVELFGTRTAGAREAAPARPSPNFICRTPQGSEDVERLVNALDYNAWQGYLAGRRQASFDNSECNSHFGKFHWRNFALRASTHPGWTHLHRGIDPGAGGQTLRFAAYADRLPSGAVCPSDSRCRTVAAPRSHSHRRQFGGAIGAMTRQHIGRATQSDRLAERDDARTGVADQHFQKNHILWTGLS
jgi:hypothetical protein